eukprot:5145660-Pyramimonas_sp.AAC.1
MLGPVQAVKEEFSKGISGDEGIWPAIHKRTEREAAKRQGARDKKRHTGLKAALLPGGSALGTLAIEGGNMAAMLPQADSVEKTKALVNKVIEEVGGALAVVGQEVALVAQQVRKTSTEQ